jgi:hypothetical protein
MTEKINRKALVTRHNPVLNIIDTESPLTVGNGDFAFTADVTGFQTLYDEYKTAPLCTMSSWGWHSMPCGYTFDDLEMTQYEINNRIFEYAVEEKSGNEEVYDYLRKNPHRFNLARISLVWNGREIKASDITEIRQELNLYTGVLKSVFKLFGCIVNVTTVCAKTADIIGFCVESTALEKGLTVEFMFPYASHKKSASDWESTDKHSTDVVNNQPLILMRKLDDTEYYIAVNENKISSNLYKLTVSFAKDAFIPVWDFEKILRDSEDGWIKFWEIGGMVDFSRSRDSRANELERRVILSQYLTAVHSAGKIPPQETGLLCNSWYGKFHLEMNILHSGWFPLWGRGELLEKSLPWYESVLFNAVKNAERNGFKGARWVKMTSVEGTDSPSRIGTLLIWQQPHIIYMLNLILRGKPENERINFMKRYWNLIKPTAEFMCDFAKLNKATGKYELPPPLIPVQEEHKPEDVLNPAFELCYWRFGLQIAVKWAKELGEDYREFEQVSNNMADLTVHNGLYIAHQNCPDTFEKYAKDHPSMLFGYGFIDSGVDKNIMAETMDKVLKCWDFESMWGWDFALMAMTLTRLGRIEEAVDILLMNTPKNSYVTSGNNFQRGREDLPLYLPGNGSLLFALPMMLAKLNDDWKVIVEGIYEAY